MSNDKELKPLTPDKAIEYLRKILQALDGVDSSEVGIPKARVLLRGVIASGIANTRATSDRDVWDKAIQIVNKMPIAADGESEVLAMKAMGQAIVTALTAARHSAPTTRSLGRDALAKAWDATFKDTIVPLSNWPDNPEKLKAVGLQGVPNYFKRFIAALNGARIAGDVAGVRGVWDEAIRVVQIATINSNPDIAVPAEHSASDRECGAFWLAVNMTSFAIVKALQAARDASRDVGVDRDAIIRECAAKAQANATKWQKHGAGSIPDDDTQAYFRGGANSAFKIEKEILALATTPTADAGEAQPLDSAFNSALDEAQRLYEQTQNGQWQFANGNLVAVSEQGESEVVAQIWSVSRVSDAEWIAAAHNLWPQLMAAIRTSPATQASTLKGDE